MTPALSVTEKDVCIEVNAEKSKYMFMSQQNAWQNNLKEC
jgi:hypothetical protein